MENGNNGNLKFTQGLVLVLISFGLAIAVIAAAFVMSSMSAAAEKSKRISVVPIGSIVINNLSAKLKADIDDADKRFWAAKRKKDDGLMRVCKGVIEDSRMLLEVCDTLQSNRLFNSMTWEVTSLTSNSITIKPVKDYF